MSFISPTKAFAHVDRLAAWKAGEKPAPVTVEWDLSNACSLGCQACHFAHTHVKGPWAARERAMPPGFESGGVFADLALVQRGLAEMADAGVRGVIWSGGGEPTLHPQWAEVVTAAHQLGLEQGMYTLGGHFTAESAAHLAKHLAWVVVSLDAPDAGTYATEKGVAAARFDAACQGVRWLSAAHSAVVGASFLLHEGNWHRARAMLQLARTLGATYTTFRPAIMTSPDRPSVCLDDREWITFAAPMLEALAAESDVELDVPRFLEYRDWKGRAYTTCYGIRLNATVTPDGRVWVCPQRRGLPDSCVGDLRLESFRAVWDRHIGQWTEFGGCRVMCRLHLLNELLAPVFETRPHEAFV